MFSGTVSGILAAALLDRRRPLAACACPGGGGRGRRLGLGAEAVAPGTKVVYGALRNFSGPIDLNKAGCPKDENRGGGRGGICAVRRVCCFFAAHLGGGAKSLSLFEADI